MENLFSNTNFLISNSSNRKKTNVKSFDLNQNKAFSPFNSSNSSTKVSFIQDNTNNNINEFSNRMNVSNKFSQNDLKLILSPRKEIINKKSKKPLSMNLNKIESDTILIKSEENENIRLNSWNKDIKTDYDLDYLGKKYSEIDIAKRKKDLRESLSNIEIRNLSKLLSNFFINIEQENAIIFFQNINLAKTNFKFDLFIDNFIKKKNDEIYRLDKCEMDYYQFHVLEKYYELKKKGDYNKLTSVDLYRGIILEKKRIENIYKKELISIGRSLINKRKEKKELKNDMESIIYDLNSQKENIIALQEALQIKKKEITNYFNMAIFKGAFRKDYDYLKTIVKDKNIFEEYDDKEDEYRNKLKNYEKDKKKYEEVLRKKEDEFNKITKDIKILEEVMKRLKIHQINYYKNLLKNGIDVRNEGLVWIIRNLIELESNIEYDMFPTFIDKECVDYLIKIANRQIDILRLEVVKKCVQIAQNKLSNSTQNIGLHIKKLCMRGRKNTNNYEDDIIIRDDKYIANIVTNLKSNMINNFSFDKEELMRNIYQEINPLYNYFTPNDKQTKNYYEIHAIKKEIKETKVIVNKLIEELNHHFKKYEKYKSSGMNYLILYDLICASLFGHCSY